MKKALELGVMKNSIRDEVLSLLTLSDEEAGYGVLNADPMARSLSEEQKWETVRRSILCAEEEYGRLVRELGVGRPSAYAFALEIDLVRETTEPSVFFPYFALYRSRPPSITIAQAAILMTRKIISEQGLELSLGKVDLEELAIAHEVFHHIEHIHPDIYTVKAKLDVVWLAGIHHKQHLNASGEIAGRHFSKLLTGLSYSPRVFEVVLKHVAVRKNEYE